MKVSVELFLLDNLLMNWLVLRLASVLVGKRLRYYVSLPASAAGALYALLSMTAAPFLLSVWPKLLFGALLACVLMVNRRGYWKCLIALYLSAFLLGGTMFGLAMLLGGEVSGGALIGTVPLRVLLITAALCFFLPRAALSLLAAYRSRMRHVRVRVDLADRSFIVWALVDSGNLLTEPVSGLPVIIVKAGLLPNEPGRPVPYAAMGADGWLNAIRPARVSAYAGDWYEINAYVAESAGPLGAEEAIIGADLLQAEERRSLHGSEAQDAHWEAVSPDTAARPEANPVSSLGRDPANAISGGGGGDVDRQAHAGG